MDLVYLTGPDPNGHTELRYSLRSMQRYLERVDQVWIVGERPEFLRDIIHIPATNIHRHNAGRNIYEKMRLATRRRELSSHFWCAADDHFLLAPLTQKRYPYYHIGDMEETVKRLGQTSKFKPYMETTVRALQERGLPTQNFNVHLPMIFEKTIFEDLLGTFDWSRPKAYLVKGLYPNALRIPGKRTFDHKIHAAKTKTAIYRFLKGCQFFSTNESSMNEPMRQVMEELYPGPSRWELPDHTSHPLPVVTAAELKERAKISLNGKINLVPPVR